jgi:serine/threonine-protein kinase HipA
MRQAQVFYQYQLAGLLSENEEGYFFVYESQYLENSNSKPVSLTLPLQ